jgi:acyl-CoA hydrolase
MPGSPAKGASAGVQQAGKPVSASRVTLAQLMGPQDANLQGNVHGGNIMKLMDEAGGSAAIRHAQRPVVTVAVDQVLFREPVHLGDLVTLVAELTYIGRSSMEVRLEVSAQNLLSGKVSHTNTAYFVYVALDDLGQPTPVPPLMLETPDEQRRWQAGQRRQAQRLAQRYSSEQS